MTRTALVLAGILAAAPAATREFHVATTGDDANPGTRARPFLTIHAAQRAARRLAADGQVTAVRVLIRGGTYFLSEPLKFGPEDTRDGLQVTYAAAEGERVVVSGGRAITGWRQGDGSVWTAVVPGVREGRWLFRQLTVNGRRAIRARTPNLEPEPGFLRLTDARLSADLKHYTLHLAPNTLDKWSNAGDAGVVVIGDWEIVRKRVQSVDAARGVVTLRPPHIRNHPAILPKRGLACYFENAREMLDQPGEWHLDRASGVLSYWPRPGEDMATARAVAPVLTRLLDVVGTAERPVRNLRFVGIHFRDADWPLPPLGYFGTQACVFSRMSWGDTKRTFAPDARGRIDAAIRWTFAHGCSLVDGSVAHVGGCGIALRKGCRDCTVEGNEVAHVGGNGIMAGECMNFHYYRDPAFVFPPAEVPRRNRIANNHVHDCGVAYHGGVGIWLAFTDAAVVAHNLVHRLPYTGISCGWMWREKPNTVCRANVIEHNHVHDVMRLLADGGCIYTLGRQDGTVLRGNLLHGVHYSRVARQSSRSNNGIFFDQGSMGFRVEANVIYDTAGPPIRFNQCTRAWHTWKDNHFLAAGPKLGPGRLGSGLRCDGRNSLDVPHDAALEPEQLTVEAWVRLARWPTPKKLAAGKSDTRCWLVAKGANEWADGHYALVIRRDQPGAYLNIGGGRGNCFYAWGKPGSLKLNAWHHLAMTYDGRVLVLYCDGREAARAPIGRKRTAGRGHLSIGRRPDGYVHFRGAIDEARLYRRALPPAEVRTHAQAPAPRTPGAEQGLICCWSFEQPPVPSRVIRDAASRAGLEPEYRRRLLTRPAPATPPLEDHR